MQLTEFNSLVQGNSLVLVDCWATWCPHCLSMMPHVDSLSKEVEGKAKVVKVNVGEEEEFASHFSVSSLPTFLIFKDGELVDRFNGSTTPRELKQRVSAFLE